MSSTDAIQVEAGPTLDVLVAVEVMGWSRDALNEGRWVPPGFRPLREGCGSYTQKPGAFSTDIAAAWEVVERVRGDGPGYEWEIRVGICDVLVRVWWDGPDGERVCAAEVDYHDPAELPRLICEAALAATTGGPVSSTRREALRRGWQEAAAGYWARDGWRIQRLTRGWHWWYVIRAGIPSPFAGAKGFERTMRAALDAVDALTGRNPAPHPPAMQSVSLGGTQEGKP